MRPEDLVVEVRDRSLNRIGQIANGEYQLTVSPLTNAVGSWSLTIRKDHPLAPALNTPGSGIVVSDPYDVVISGPTSTPQSVVSTDDIGGSVTFAGFSDEQCIFDRLAYPDPSTADTMAMDSDYDIRTGPAESVIRAYVDNNAGPSAPTERQVLGLMLEIDGAAGATVAKQARFDNLGDLITGIAQSANLTWRVVQRGSNLVLEIRTVNDRSKTVRLDIDNNTLDARTVAITAPTGTKVIVGSLDVALDRLFATVTSDVADQSEQSWGRRIESFLDQAYAADEDTWTQGAREQLATTAPTNIAVQAVANTDSDVAFGKDWGLGDIVGIVVDGQEVSSTVSGLVLQADADGVKIGAVLGDASGFSPALANARQIAEMQRRVSQLERVPTQETARAAGKAVEAKDTADTAQLTATTADGKAVTAQSTATAAASTAASAASDAATALAAATAAAAAATTAQTTANGKNTVYYSTSNPSGTPATGDVWFKTASTIIIGQWVGSGGSWVSVTVGSAVIANIDAGKITTGTLTGIDIIGTTLSTVASLGTAGVQGMQMANDTSGGVLQFWTGATAETGPGSINPVTFGSNPYLYLSSPKTSAGQTSISLGGSNMAVTSPATQFSGDLEVDGNISVPVGHVTVSDGVIAGKLFTNTTDSSTSAANVRMLSGGQLVSTTSLSRHKLDQQEISLDRARGALLLTPKTWYDRAEVEDNDGSTEGLRRIAGLVAEDVAEHAPELAERDSDGNLQGVAYDRVPAFLIPIIRDQQDRIERLEALVDQLLSESTPS